MNVSEIMTKSVNVVSDDGTLADAARIMWECDCGCVPVVDDRGHVVGAITDRDICMAAYTKGATLEELMIRDAMSRRPLTCKETDSIASVEQTMRDAQLRRVPVVADGGRAVGMITLADIARAAGQRATRDGNNGISAGEVCSTLSAVSAPRTQSASP